MSDSRKRIAILADFPWSYFDRGASGRGGGQACTWLAQLAEEFARDRRFDMHWVTLDRSRWLGRAETREWGGQTFHRIPIGKAKIDMLLRYAPSRLRLMGQLRKIRPDLVHCWGTERSYPVVCGRNSVPSILSMQGVLGNLWKHDLLPRTWFVKGMVDFEPTFLRSATVVTCESQWGADRVLGIHPQADIRQVEYGVHPGFFDVEWKPVTTDPYVLFIGTINSNKGADLLLDAVASIKERNWTLKLAGAGSLRCELEARRVPGVEWLGTLDWQELQPLMAGASALVHPTRADSSPNAVKEARVVGLPVVTTKHGGQSGYIHDGENGIIVDPLEPAGLAAALGNLMSDPGRIRRMGNARHVDDREYFRASRTARGFLEIYGELTNRLRDADGEQSR